MQRASRAGSPDSQFSRWLRMVSMAIVVLPVLRSPMISSRWPRPIGVMASMALMPVCSGWLTGSRAPPPRALRHARRDHFHRPALVGDNRPLAIQWIAQRIDHAADYRVPHRHAE